MLKLAAALFALVAFPAARPAAHPSRNRADRPDRHSRARDRPACPRPQSPSSATARSCSTKAYGQANERPAGDEPTLPYQIASISKQFTAMALLLLADEGKLRLDDHVSKYLPGITGGDRITIRQLLSHTSGLQDFWPQDYSFEAMIASRRRRRRSSTAGRRSRSISSRATQWQYSQHRLCRRRHDRREGQRRAPARLPHRSESSSRSACERQTRTRRTAPAFPAGYGRYALGPVRSGASAGARLALCGGRAVHDRGRSRQMGHRADQPRAAARARLGSAGDGGQAEQRQGHRLRPWRRPPHGRRRTITHGGEAVGFLSANNVYPDDRLQSSVLTNSWSAGAYTRIARDIAKAHPAPGDAAGRHCPRPGGSSAGSCTTSLRAGRLTARS